MGADYLEQAVARLAERCASAGPTLKSQKKLVRYQGDVLRCGDDVQALCRFTNAQAEAFRKILKKYKVWPAIHTTTTLLIEPALVRTAKLQLSLMPEEMDRLLGSR